MQEEWFFKDDFNDDDNDDFDLIDFEDRTMKFVESIKKKKKEKISSRYNY